MAGLLTFEVGSRQELDSRFEAQISNIRAYASVYFEGHREHARLVIEVVERVWYTAVRKFECGHPIHINLGITCLGVCVGYNNGDTGNLSCPAGRANFLRIRRGYNDSRDIQDRRVNEEHRTTRLDVKHAIATIGQTKPMLARVLRLVLRGRSRKEVGKRLHVGYNVVAEALATFRDLLAADYAEA